MSDFISYQNVAVSIGGVSDLFASSASMSNEVSFSSIRAVGIKGSAGMVMDGPPSSSASIDAVGGVPQPDLNMTGNNAPEINVSIGGSAGSFHPTSISSSVSPNSVASGSWAGTAFKQFALNTNGGSGGSSSASVGELFKGGHGGSTSSTGNFSAEYSFSASYDALYKIGSLCPLQKYATDATEEISVDGGDISGNILSCDDCPSAGGGLTFTIGSLCNKGVRLKYTISKGFSTGGTVSVSEGGVLSGSQTVVSFLV